MTDKRQGIDPGSWSETKDSGVSCLVPFHRQAGRPVDAGGGSSANKPRAFGNPGERFPENPMEPLPAALARQLEDSN